MKFKNFIASASLFASMAVTANSLPSVIENVKVSKTETSKLSLQNLSKETVTIDILGETFAVKPASGVTIHCASFQALELKVTNIEHDYFAVPCMSRVVISENFATNK